MARTDAPEQAIIAALLVDPSQIPVVSSKLEAEDFGQTYRPVYRRMVELSHAGQRVDVVTLRADGVDVPVDVLNILGHGRADDLGAYIEAVQEGGFRRRVSDFGSRIQTISRTARDRAEILGELQAFNTALAQDAKDQRLLAGDSVSDVYLSELTKRRKGGAGIPYGIGPLDRLIQPATGGDLIVVAARPSVGKTVFAEIVADNWAFEADKPVLFVSVEMRLSALIDRAVSRWSGIPTQRLLRGHLSDNEEALARETLERRRDVKIWYADDPMATSTAVRAHAARASLQSDGLQGIIVDYLQLLKDPGDNDNQRVGSISRNLKGIAREFDVPMIALSQLSRAPELRGGRHNRPRLSDLRDSGAIEQDADLVFGLYRDGSDLEVHILKNRQGPAGISVDLYFDNDTVSFRED